jgi:hypothetical protein
LNGSEWELLLLPKLPKIAEIDLVSHQPVRAGSFSIVNLWQLAILAIGLL